MQYGALASPHITGLPMSGPFVPQDKLRSVDCSILAASSEKAHCARSESGKIVPTSGRSSVGRARGSGPRGRRFESFRPDHSVQTRKTNHNHSTVLRDVVVLSLTKESFMLDAPEDRKRMEMFATQSIIPTWNCLDTLEVRLLSEGTHLPAERMVHLAGCTYCQMSLRISLPDRPQATPFVHG